MSDNKNSYSFDKELLSSLDKLKKKYASFDDLEVDVQDVSDEPEQVDYEIKTQSASNDDGTAAAEYKIKQKKSAKKEEQKSEFSLSDSIKNKKNTEEPAEYDFSEDFNKENEAESNEIYSYSTKSKRSNNKSKSAKKAAQAKDEPVQDYSFVKSGKPQVSDPDDIYDEFDDLDNEDDIGFKREKKAKDKSQKPDRFKFLNKLSKKNKIIILAVGIPVLIWLSMFITDLILVNQWYSPFFCIETAQYENGGSDYVGLFYKVQFKVDSNGEESGEIIPWFVKGINDK